MLRGIATTRGAPSLFERASVGNSGKAAECAVLVRGPVCQRLPTTAQADARPVSIGLDHARACLSDPARVTHWDLRTIRHLDGCGAAAGRGGAMDGVSEVKAGDQRSVASSVYTRTLRRVSAHGSTHVLHRDVEVARFFEKKFAERFRSGQKSNRFEAMNNTLASEAS